MQKAVRYYFYVAGVLLLTTAIAKLVSANGSARILDNPDPLFSVSFREVFRIVGAIEIFVAILCFSSRRVEMQTGWVAWLATNFVFYHIALVLIRYHRSCPCLGNLTDAIQISPYDAVIIMRGVSAYLFIGSYGILFWLWHQHVKAQALAASVTSNDKMALK